MRFLSPLLNYAVVALAVRVLWGFPILLGVVLLANLGVLVSILPISRNRALRTALAAAILGGVGETLCVHVAKLWTYREPTALWGLPLWIPLVWANLFLLFIHWGETLAEVAPRVPSAARFLASAAFLLYLGQALGRTHPGVATGFALALAACGVWFHERADIVVGLVGAIVGTFGEVLAMREGFWSYTAPLYRGGLWDRLGLEGFPVTLPLAWGLSAVLIRRAGAAHA